MDKFKDECGVFGIFGHPEAANMTYLGLYASLFAEVVPLLIAMWLSAFWLLRGLSDAMFAHRF